MLDKLKDWQVFWWGVASYFLLQWLWGNSTWHAQEVIRDEAIRDAYKQWVHGELLESGLAGTYQTLEWMRALVRRDARLHQVRDFAASLVHSCPGHRFECEIRKIFEYVRDSITYRKDPSEVERVQDTLHTIFIYRSGDCDDKSVALASLLGALGHRSRFVVIGHDGHNFSHVFLEAWTGRRWIPLDPTNEQAPIGWQAQGAMREVYEIF